SATGGLLSDAEDVGAVELGRAEREQLLVRRGRCVGEQLDGPGEVVDLVGVAGDLEVPLDHAAGGGRLGGGGGPVTEPERVGGGGGVRVGAGGEREAADEGAGRLGLGGRGRGGGAGLAGGGGLGVDAVAAGPVCAPGGRVVDDLFAFAP